MLEITLAVLAVYRAARMLALEDGPFDAFANWRELWGQTSWLGRGFHCPLCISFWAGLAAALWLCAFGYCAWALLPLLWFGLSGAATVLLTREPQ